MNFKQKVLVEPYLFPFKYGDGTLELTDGRIIVTCKGEEVINRRIEDMRTIDLSVPSTGGPVLLNDGDGKTLKITFIQEGKKTAWYGFNKMKMIEMSDLLDRYGYKSHRTLYTRIQRIINRVFTIIWVTVLIVALAIILIDRIWGL